jgi:hypothetical protein
MNGAPNSEALPQSPSQGIFFDEGPASPRYQRIPSDATQLEEMNKFSCWKPLIFIAGLLISIAGLLFAGAGFGLFGVGEFISAPVGACICAFGVGLMTGTGIFMYLEHKKLTADFEYSVISLPDPFLSRTNNIAEVLGRYKKVIPAGKNAQ